MKKACLLLAGVFTFCMAAAVFSQTEVPAGQKAFVDSKCNMCHAIESVKVEKKMATSKAPDLSDVGSSRTSEWITKWLKKEEAIDGKKHVATTKLTDPDMKTVSDWLATLKKPAAK